MFEKMIQDILNTLYKKFDLKELINVPLANIDVMYIINKKMPLIKQVLTDILTEEYKEELKNTLKEDILKNPDKYLTTVIEKDEKVQQFIQYAVADYLSKQTK